MTNYELQAHKRLPLVAKALTELFELENLEIKRINKECDIDLELISLDCIGYEVVRSQFSDYYFVEVVVDSEIYDYFQNDNWLDKLQTVLTKKRIGFEPWSSSVWHFYGE